jgi:hypothetical protein
MHPGKSGTALAIVRMVLQTKGLIMAKGVQQPHSESKGGAYICNQKCLPPPMGLSTL